jgi:hypothetical protein
MTGTASTSSEQTPLPIPTLRPIGDAGAASCDPDSDGACALPARTHESS